MTEGFIADFDYSGIAIITWTDLTLEVTPNKKQVVLTFSKLTF